MILIIITLLIGMILYVAVRMYAHNKSLTKKETIICKCLIFISIIIPLAGYFYVTYIDFILPNIQKAVTN